MFVSFPIKLLDVFGHKSNVSLVFDFMETDLEVKIYFMNFVLHLWLLLQYLLLFLKMLLLVVFV